MTVCEIIDLASDDLFELSCEQYVAEMSKAGVEIVLHARGYDPDTRQLWQIQVTSDGQIQFGGGPDGDTCWAIPVWVLKKAIEVAEEAAMGGAVPS